MMCDNEITEQMKSPAAPRVNSEAHAKRTVWQRDNATCVNCNSTYAVQIEHRIPQAKGGKSMVENMCVLCRSCNQRRAIEEYGIEKMNHFLKEPITEYSWAAHIEDYPSLARPPASQVGRQISLIH
jgi:5-methylcytosine-specific restriction endonuclease McrA